MAEEKKYNKKLGEQKKVELLEAAVLAKDLKEIDTLFEVYGEFELTARALGLACRFCGKDVVEALLKHSVSFAYDKEGSIPGRYKCKVEYSNKYSEAVEFSHYLLRSVLVTGYKKRMLPESEIAEVIECLLENDCCNLDAEELLYFSILYRDKNVYEVLSAHGVTALSEERKNLLFGIQGFGTSVEKLYPRRKYQNMLVKASDEERLWMLERFLDASKEEILKVTPEMCEEYYLKHFCKPVVFRFMQEHSDLLSKANLIEVVNILSEDSNMEGIRYVLTNTGIDKGNLLRDYIAHDNMPMIKFMLEACKLTHQAIKKAIDTAKGKTEITAMLLRYQEANIDVMAEEIKEIRRKTSLPSDTELLKKNWTSKNNEDGTLTISRYKGTDEIVSVPARIGKKDVTVLGYYSPRRMSSSPNMWGDASVKKVIVPEGIRKISSFTFWRCNNLMEIEIQSKLDAIDFYAICGCPKLMRVVFREDAKQVREGFVHEFEGIIVAPAGSNIEKVAKEQNLKFKTLEE